MLLPHNLARGYPGLNRLYNYYTIFLFTSDISYLLARLTSLRRDAPSLPTNHNHLAIHAPSLHLPRQPHMAPPWVTFDSIAYFNGSCANGADPDIASLGVLPPPPIPTSPIH
jgi:hypothetical protein